MKIKDTWESITISQLTAGETIRHMSQSVKLVYILSGQVEILAEDYTMTFGLGEFFVVPNFSDVTILFLDETSRVYTIMLAYFKDEASDEVEIFKGDSKSKGEAINSTLSRSLGQLLKLYYLNKESASYWEVHSLYFFIISKLEKKYLIKLPRQKGVLALEGVTAYVEQHLSDEVTIEDLARHFYVSRQTMTRFFKQNLGQTFSEYLRERRFLQLEEKLSTTSIPVNQLVYDLGFKNLNSFNRLFKKKYGLSPNQWRRKNKKEKQIEQTLETFDEFQEYKDFIKEKENRYSVEVEAGVLTKDIAKIWNVKRPELLLDYQIQQQLHQISEVLSLETLRFPLDLDVMSETYYEGILDFLQTHGISPYFVVRQSSHDQTSRLIRFLRRYIAKNGYRSAQG